MIDQEKVIKGLECCGYIDRPNCADCPEDGPGFGYACRNDLMKKALALLKAQEPVKPQEYDPAIYGHRYVCWKCHHKIWRNDNFCPNCGQAVKWE